VPTGHALKVVHIDANLSNANLSIPNKKQKTHNPTLPPADGVDFNNRSPDSTVSFFGYIKEE